MLSFEMKLKNENRPVRNILFSISFIIFFLTKNGQSVPKSRSEKNEVTDESNPSDRPVLPSLSSQSATPRKLTPEGNLLESFHKAKIRRSVGQSESEFRNGRTGNSKTDSFDTHPPISKRHWNKFLKSIGIRSHTYSRGQSRFTDTRNELEESKPDLYFKHGKTILNLENDDPNFDFINFIEYYFGDLKDTGFDTDSEISQDDVVSEKNNEETPLSIMAENSPVVLKRSADDDVNDDGEDVVQSHKDLQTGGESRFLPWSEDEGTEWTSEHRNLSRKRRQKVSSGDHPKGDSLIRRKRRRKHRHRPRTTGSDLPGSNLRKEEEKLSSNNHPEKFLLKSDSPSYVITSAGELKKDWCRTMPLRQKVVERNCRAKVIMNHFCYGQCNSFFIPHPGKTGSHSAFQSCAFCKPHRPKWTNVTLQCPGQNPPKREKRVLIVESCRCLTEVFQ